MGKREILVTPYAEMLDMLACFAIDNGAKQATEKMNMETKLFRIN